MANHDSLKLKLIKETAFKRMSAEQKIEIIKGIVKKDDRLEKIYKGCYTQVKQMIQEDVETGSYV